MSVERLLSLRRSRIIPPGFIAGLKEKLGSPGADVQSALEYCSGTNSPVGRIFRAGILSLPRGEAFVEKAIEDQGANETDKLKRSLRWLGIIASISPLLGLLGTVYGMINAFESSTMMAGGKAEFLARGIYEALVTTAAGLTIAIPVLIMFQYLSSRIDSIVDDIDEMGVEFLEFYSPERRHGP
jgi:biopolymer transport protein ExbB